LALLQRYCRRTSNKHNREFVFNLQMLYLMSRTSDKRKEERKCLPEFFERHLRVVLDTKSRCAECNDLLKGNVSEIAHVMPKGYFKSIMCNDLNVIYLCGMYSENQCHSKFDNSAVEVVKTMKIYKIIRQRFQILRGDIKEKLSYRHYELYE